MKNRLLISALMFVITSLMAGAQATRHEVKIGDFKRLAVVDGINVNYRCNPDSAGIAVFTCPQEVADMMMFSVSASGRVTIQFVDGAKLPPQLPVMTIYSSSLEEVENAGDSTLRLSGLPMMPLFKVRLLDNGKIIARDLKASKLELQLLSGKGKIIASGVMSMAETSRSTAAVRVKSITRENPIRSRSASSEPSRPSPWSNPSLLPITPCPTQGVLCP